MTSWENTVASWRHAKDEIGDRLIVILRPYPLLYAVVAMGVIGGMGLWLAVVMNHLGMAAPRDVHISVVTFAVAVSFTGAFDGNFARATSKLMQLLSLAGVVLVIVVCAYFNIIKPISAKPVTWTNVNAAAEWWPIVLGVIPALFVWLFLNATDSRFVSEIHANAAGGGDPMQEL